MSFYDDFYEDKTVPSFESSYSDINKIIETGSYDVIIKKAYYNVSGQNTFSKAKRLVVVFADNAGKELGISEYVTGRDGKTSFYNGNSGKSQNLKGYSILKAIEFLVNNNKDKLPDVEIRKVKVFDYRLKEETIEDKPVILSWIGKRLTV
ncbi:MAG: hypothetical protein LBD17_02745, partial [Endomicrobium sp.]|nr:hypothetical protein [Endomicrobium sp.]